MTDITIRDVTGRNRLQPRENPNNLAPTINWTITIELSTSPNYTPVALYAKIGIEAIFHLKYILAKTCSG